MSALDDHLEDALAPDEADERFVVDTLDKAAWAGDRIAFHMAKIAEAEAAAQKRLHKTQAWLEAETNRHAGRVEHLEYLLGQWLKSEIEADPKGPKSRALPSGVVVKRKGGTESVVIEDEDTLVAWLEVHAPQVLEREEIVKPPKKKLRAAFTQQKADDLGRAALMTEDGEPVPGVHIERSPHSYKVEAGRQT